MRFAILVRGADQLDRRDEPRPALGLVHAHLELVRERGRHHNRRGGWRVSLRHNAPVLRCGLVREGRDINFDSRTGVGVFLREIAFGQKRFVQRVGDGAGPGDVKRLPVPPRVERGVKVIQERHAQCLRG